VLCAVVAWSIPHHNLPPHAGELLWVSWIRAWLLRAATACATESPHCSKDTYDVCWSTKRLDSTPAKQIPSEGAIQYLAALMHGRQCD